jgi:hypothetical protein
MNVRIHLVDELPFSTRTQELARALDAADANVGVSERPDSPADFYFWHYPGAGINPGLLSSTVQYVDRFRALLGDVPAERVVLFDTPRGPESIELADALGLAATIDEHDLWVGLTPGLLGTGTIHDSGIAGRIDVLHEISPAVAHARGRYAKSPVRPFPSLVALILGYLKRYSESLNDH